MYAAHSERVWHYNTHMARIRLILIEHLGYNEASMQGVHLQGKGIKEYHMLEAYLL